MNKKLRSGKQLEEQDEELLLQFGRKLTMMTALVTMAVGGSFPFFLSPTPDLYYSLVISRYVTKCLQVCHQVSPGMSPSVSILLTLPQVHLWPGTRGHLHDHLQPGPGVRGPQVQDLHRDHHRDTLLPGGAGGGPGLLGRGQEVADTHPRPQVGGREAALVWVAGSSPDFLVAGSSSDLPGGRELT